MKVCLLIHFIENRHWLVIQFAVDYHLIVGISTMAIDTMKKGSIEMLTLFLLCEEDAYGYQLVQKIKERSKGFITVQEGSFYPLLYRLADDGYITGEEVVTRMSTGRSRMRVIYHIESAGRERLASLKKDYETVQQGIHNILDS